jgi:hypothetical protein
MQELIMAMLMNEQLTQMRADSDARRHAAAARDLRRPERRAARDRVVQRPEPYLGFLPRLIDYPFSR